MADTILQTSDYVIGVGGTGSRCVDALTRLLILGVGQRTDRGLSMLLVDADMNNPRKTEIENMIKEYGAMRRQIGSCDVLEKTKSGRDSTVPADANNHPYRRPVDVVDKLLWPPHNRINSAQREKSLRSMLNAGDGIERDIASIFLDEGPLDMVLNDGFNAQPGVGAAVISLMADPVWTRTNTDTMSRFLVDLRSQCVAGPVQVVVTGSVFGGTGSAGIPQLARSIVQALDGTPGRANLKLHAVIMAPYFIPKDPKDQLAELEKDPEVDPKRLAEYRRLIENNLYADLAGNSLRAKDVLRVLEEEELYDTICILGETEPMMLTKWAGGGKEQDNKPHYLEVVAGLTILQLVGDDPLLKKNEPKEAYIYSRADSKRDVKLELLPGGAVHLQDFRRALAHAIFLRFEAGDIWENDRADQDVANLKRHLELLSKGYQWWFEELPQGDKDVRLFQPDPSLAELLGRNQMSDPAQFIYRNEGNVLRKGNDFFIEQLLAPNGKNSAMITKLMGCDIKGSEFHEIFHESFNSILTEKGK